MSLSHCQPALPLSFVQWIILHTDDVGDVFAVGGGDGERDADGGDVVAGVVAAMDPADRFGVDIAGLGAEDGAVIKAGFSPWRMRGGDGTGSCNLGIGGSGIESSQHHYPSLLGQMRDDAQWTARAAVDFHWQCNYRRACRGQHAHISNILKCRNIVGHQAHVGGELFRLAAIN